MNLSGTASAITMADGSGDYTFQHLSNGTYAVTPSKSGLVFNPVQRLETVNNQNMVDIDFTVSLVDPCGDVTGDSRVDLNDLVMVLQILSGSDETPSIQGDCNADAHIGMDEAIAIMRRITNL